MGFLLCVYANSRRIAKITSIVSYGLKKLMTGVSLYLELYTTKRWKVQANLFRYCLEI